MDATKPQTDREWLVQIDGKVDSILARLEKGDTCMEDYGDRLDVLEKFQAKFGPDFWTALVKLP